MNNSREFDKPQIVAKKSGLKAPTGKPSEYTEKGREPKRKKSLLVVGCDGMAQNLEDPLYQALFSEGDKTREEEVKEEKEEEGKREKR